MYRKTLILTHFYPIWGQKWIQNMAPGAHILQTYISGPNPEEYFCKIDKNLNFDLFWRYSMSKTDQKYDPRVHTLNTYISSSNELKESFTWI